MTTPAERFLGSIGVTLPTSVLALLLATAASATAAVNFAQPTTLYPGDRPAAVAVADFNGDSDPDLAFANRYAHTVAVMLGGAGGSFGPRTAYGVGAGPNGVVARDFNGDGDPDLAVISAGSSLLSIFVGGSGGSFGEASDIVLPSGGYLGGLAAGDFNGDGDPDLAVSNRGGDLVVLLGGSGASFGAPTKFYASTYDINSIALGDFNGDGDPDAAVAGYDNDGKRLSVLPGGAGGSFGAAVRYQTGSTPYALATGDFDGDGRPDLATTNGTYPYSPQAIDNSVLVRTGAGDGTFASQNAFPAGTVPIALVPADLNLDGDLDLAVSNNSSGTVSVLLGASRAAFAPRTTFAAGPGPGAIGAGDFNGDGFPDLVVVNELARAASVLLNSPEPSVQPSSIAFQPRPDHTESERKTVTLTNHGAPDLTVNGVSLTGIDPGSFIASSDTCTGNTLGSGETCTTQIRFRPLGTGSKTAELRFTFAGSVPGQSVALSGTGTPGPWLQANPQALKYGTVQVGSTAPAKSVALTNVGSAPMAFSDIAVQGNNPGDFVDLTETCTSLASLDPGDACTAELAFRPTATGLRTATLAVTHSAPRSPLRIALTGTGN